MSRSLQKYRNYSESLKKANARIAELEKREAEKDIRIEKQSAEIKAQEDEIKNLKETIASLMGHQFGKRAEEYIPEVKTEEFNTVTVAAPESAENRKEKPIFLEHDKSKVVYLKDEETRRKTCGRQQIEEGDPDKEVIRKVPEDYMRNVFEKAPYCETQEDWEKLLPWNIEMTPFNEEDGWC